MMLKEVFASIQFGLKEVFTWHTMKYVLVSGFLVMALWVGIGLFVWEPLVKMSQWFIGFLPLNMILSDGAFMLSAFLWFLLSLLSTTFIYLFFGNFLMNKVAKERYTRFSLILLGVNTLFWGVIWWLNREMIHQEMASFLKTLPYTTVEEGLALLFAGYILYNGVIVTLLFVVNLLNRPLLTHLATRHYDEACLAHHSWGAFGYTLKDTLLFLGISLLLFPLLFVPFINVVVQIALWVWLSKDTIQYNTASLVFENPQEVLQKGKHKEIWLISTMAVLFNFIPFLNIFSPFFAEVTLFHYWKQLAKAS